MQEAPVQAQSKKEAKQLAAAALLEVMLEHVPFQDLLYKSDRQQNSKNIQVSFCRCPQCGFTSCALCTSREISVLYSMLSVVLSSRCETRHVFQLTSEDRSANTAVAVKHSASQPTPFMRHPRISIST